MARVWRQCYHRTNRQRRGKPQFQVNVVSVTFEAVKYTLIITIQRFHFSTFPFRITFGIKYRFICLFYWHFLQVNWHFLFMCRDNDITGLRFAKGPITVKNTCMVWWFHFLIWENGNSHRKWRLHEPLPSTQLTHWRHVWCWWRKLHINNFL